MKPRIYRDQESGAILLDDGIARHGPYDSRAQAMDDWPRIKHDRNRRLYEPETDKPDNE